MVLCFEDRKIEPSRIMRPHVESDLLEIVLWHDREAPRPQDHALQFNSGSRQFATYKFFLSSDPVGRLCGGLIVMWVGR